MIDGKLGKFHGEKIEIGLEKEVKPVFLEPRPFAFKKKIEEKLDKLEKNGVISLRSNNKWGTPLVPII